MDLGWKFWYLSVNSKSKGLYYSVLVC